MYLKITLEIILRKNHYIFCKSDQGHWFFKCYTLALNNYIAKKYEKKFCQSIKLKNPEKFIVAHRIMSTKTVLARVKV